MDARQLFLFKHSRFTAYKPIRKNTKKHAKPVTNDSRPSFILFSYLWQATPREAQLVLHTGLHTLVQVAGFGHREAVHVGGAD